MRTHPSRKHPFTRRRRRVPVARSSAGRRWRVQVVGAGVAIVVALSSQSFASAREGAATYLIKPGETLSGIAVATGVSVDKLVTLNGLSNPDLILAGQVLQLAGADGSPRPADGAPGTYTVKPGDTLWGIAITTGVSMDALVSLNNLADVDRLMVGQQLKLPAQTQTQTPTQTPTPAPTQTAPSATLRAASVSNTTLSLASPTPTPAPKATPQKPALKQSPTDALQQRVVSEARRVGGANVRLGVAAKNLVTGDRIAVNAGDEFPSASVMKLPILLELERQTGSGALTWTDSLRAEATAMITISDNTAADQIADTLGLKAVNDTLGRLGLSGTHFRNLFVDSRSAQNPGYNETSPADMAKLLEMIATDQVLTPQATADMRSLLARNIDRSKLVRLLPGDARVAHKSGWYEGVANDVGIVSVDRTGARWVIAVFTQNVPDTETGNQVVAAVSRAVYDAWAGAGGGG